MRTSIVCCLRLALLLAVVLTSSQFCLAADSQTMLVDADTQYAFAERLYAKEEYLLAVNEYKRFIFLFPGHERVAGAMFRIGTSYSLSGRYEASIAAFKALIAEFPNSEFAERSHFSISESYVSMGQSGAAVANLRNLIVLADDIEVKDRAHYQMGWIYIGMARWSPAQESFNRISSKGRDRYRLQALSEALAEEGRVKRKSPGLAGTLAIVPGAGYLYLGRYQDALAAFLVNAGLIWAAYESFDNELYALGTVITVVEIGFYAGNIYGSVSSAHKYNHRQERRWIENLKQNLKVELSARRETRGVELSLNYKF